jgi:hypothetical protein
MAFGLARFDLTQLTRSLALPEISADPAHPLTLILRFCGIGNRDWEAWRFARDAATSDADPKKPTAQRIAENRADMRDCLATVGLSGWENVLDDNGTPVAFAPDTAKQFAAEVHDRIPATLAKIADWAATRSNFATATRIDPADLGKDAPRG